jgi:transposase
MRKIREVLRLKLESGLSQRQIAQSLSMSCSTVCEILYRARGAHLDLEKMEKMDDLALDALIYPSPSGRKHKDALDFEYIHSELKHKGVTLLLLWYEYKQSNPDGYQYSQFCEHYRKWAKRIDPVLRQSYRAGEKMFVDYAGQTMRWVEADTGEMHEAQVFVAVLGASNYTYALAQPSQQLEHWIDAHCNAFQFFGGVTRVVVPDNARSGVSKACYYEPELNLTYAEMATHYGTAIVPARPKKPTDKAKVESAVQAVERELLAPLRKRKFFSLAEIQAALDERLAKLNSRPFQKLEGSRKTAYESLDRPALKALPSTRYELAEWRKARVSIDYHIEVEKNLYSVPYNLVREQVDVRLTARVLEVLHNGKRVASHPRSYGRGVLSTDPEHRPAAHRMHLEWTPSRILSWAASVGEQCGYLCEHILKTKVHPEQGYRSCLGVMSLGKRYGAERLEAACQRALHIASPCYKSVKSILENALDRKPLDNTEPEASVGSHANIRGQAYYHEELIANAQPAHAGETSQDEA